MSLNEAVSVRNVEVVKWMLDHMDEVGFDELKGFVIAIGCGDQRIVECFQNVGMNVHSLDGKGRTLLMAAVDCGSLDVVKDLVFLSIDINKRDEFGKTALVYAALGMEYKIFEHLISAGAQVEYQDIMHFSGLFEGLTKDGDTVYQIRVERGSVEISVEKSTSESSRVKKLSYFTEAESGLSDSDSDSYSDSNEARVPPARRSSRACAIEQISTRHPKTSTSANVQESLIAFMSSCAMIPSYQQKKKRRTPIFPRTYHKDQEFSFSRRSGPTIFNYQTLDSKKRRKSSYLRFSPN